MKDSNKILNFNDYCDKRDEKVSNLKIYSKKKRRYRLLKNLIPYIAVGSLFTGIAHFLGGISIMDGEIMQFTSLDYGKDDNFSDMNGKQYLHYYGPWVEEENGYSREVKYYDAQYFNYDDIVDIVKDKNISILDYYFINSKREFVRHIPIEEKLFNDSSMSYMSFKNNGSDSVSNVGVAGIVDYVAFYIIAQFGVIVVYNRCMKPENEEVQFSKSKKKNTRF